MFDFQKLDVYQKSKNFCKEIYSILDEKNFDKVTNDQLRRASFSIMLNIAEGTSRFSNKDRKNFFVIAIGSAFECVAILEYLHETEEITQQVFRESEQRLEEISKMLFGLIRGLDKKVHMSGIEFTCDDFLAPALTLTHCSGGGSYVSPGLKKEK